jgi:hypothetical protein
VGSAGWRRLGVAAAGSDAAGADSGPLLARSLCYGERVAELQHTSRDADHRRLVNFAPWPIGSFDSISPTRFCPVQRGVRSFEKLV